MKKTVYNTLLLMGMALGIMKGEAQTHNIFLLQSIQGDTLNVDFCVQTKQELPAGLGDASFIVEYDTSCLSFIGKDEEYDGCWDFDYSDDYWDFYSCHVSPNASLDMIKKGPGNGVDIPADVIQIGRIMFKIHFFNVNSGIAWSTTIPPSIYSWEGNDITNMFNIINPDAYFLSYPTAYFVADSTSGYNPFQVHFADSSSGEITNWEWDFGDGQTSTEPSPEHIYTEAGTFSVCLSVTGPAGSDRYIREDYIIVMCATNITDQFDLTPTSFQLYQNYPNPFNPETRFCYQLPEESDVSVIIYSLLGQKIREVVHTKQPAGHYEGIWNGRDDLNRDVPSGIYILQIHAGSFKAVRRMTLIR